MEIIKLNLIPSGATPVVHVKQYDIGRTWRFELYEGAAVYTLDGTEVLECDVKKLDGNIVTISVTNTSSSYVDIETTVQMTACSGDQLGALRITKGGDDIATINFILACQRSPLEGGITSDSAIHDLQTQVAGYVAAEVADQYDSANVLFDPTPTAGHGVPYAVTSEGVKTEVDNLNTALSGKVDTTDFYATNLPIQSGSATNTKDYIDNIAPQLYRVVGLILNSDGGTINGAGTANITLSNGIARIDFALMIEVDDTVSHNNWGINRDFFTATVGKTITPILGGVFTYFTDTGIIYSDRQGYGGAFVVANQFWKPSRIYKASSNPDTYSTGSWADTLFPVGSRMVGTCFGTYT